MVVFVVVVVVVVIVAVVVVVVFVASIKDLIQGTVQECAADRLVQLRPLARSTSCTTSYKQCSSKVIKLLMKIMVMMMKMTMMMMILK